MKESFGQWKRGALAVALLAACATTTLTSAWKDETYTGGPIQRILIIGVTENPINRRIFEDQFVAELASRGTEAEESYRVFEGDAKLTREEIEAGIRGKGYGGVLVVSLVARRTEAAYYPETVTVDRIGGWYGAYTQRWEATRTPAHVEQYEVATLEARLFDGSSEALIWSALFDTELQGSVNLAMQSFVKTAAKSLREAQLVNGP